MNVLDLFCSCGGFRLGFEKIGFNIRFAIDLAFDFALFKELNID
ncbi:MAG: DNA cytosine methyltransferase [Candidatus Thorarchaeota archaeon]